jgi:hypothetical protein
MNMALTVQSKVRRDVRVTRPEYNRLTIMQLGSTTTTLTLPSGLLRHAAAWEYHFVQT